MWPIDDITSSPNYSARFTEARDMRDGAINEIASKESDIHACVCRLTVGGVADGSFVSDWSICPSNANSSFVW